MPGGCWPTRRSAPGREGPTLGDGLRGRRGDAPWRRCVGPAGRDVPRRDRSGRALGVGLAATQLGVLHRMLVYKAYVEDPLTVLVNPEIEWQSEERETAEEGCLSLPGVHVEVERAAAVRVRGRDASGAALEIEAEG